jgi:hypothetical protein
MCKKCDIYIILLTVITFIGLFLRFFHFQEMPFTHDELSAMARVHFDHFHDLIQYGVLVEGHPAGVQVFLWLWTKLFGTSEMVVKLPFVLMGIASVPLMYRVDSLWFNKSSGLFAAAFMAVSQYAIHYSLLARPYIAGLFFVLLFLIPWSKIVFHKDFSWKNIILFGAFAAGCAYIHQFAMLTAFLIAFSGLFFLRKQHITKYLIACVISIILYLPHLSILLHQISLQGVGEWLGKPTPAFVADYLKYLLHFSWITIGGILLAFLLSSSFKLTVLKANITKIILALLLFVLPLLIGYVYSIKVNPVLQFSCLIFSFPFFLLLFCSFMDEKWNIRKSISIGVMVVTMIYGLVFIMEHYRITPRQWYKLGYEKAIQYQQLKGEDQVACMIMTTHPFYDYYKNHFGIDVHNMIYKEDDCHGNDLQEQLIHCTPPYLVIAGVSDEDLALIQEYYPYLIDYYPCFTSEISVLSKHPEAKQEQIGMPLIYKESFFYVNIDPSSEYYKDGAVAVASFNGVGQLDPSSGFIPIKEVQLNEIAHSRFTKLLLTCDFIKKDFDLIHEYSIILETQKYGELIDWREKKVKECYYQIGDTCRVVLPLRYELLAKHSNQLNLFNIKSYLWNITNDTCIVPFRVQFFVYEDNRYIYGNQERLY